MVDLKGFRKANKLTQTDVGDYLGITKSFISRIENYVANLTDEKLNQLLHNPYGWDTSMLVVDSTIRGDVSLQTNGQGNVGKMVADAEILSLRRENEILQNQLAELKEQNERYWSMIEKLTSKQ